jgi:Flp pilus assembly protein TadD
MPKIAWVCFLATACASAQQPEAEKPDQDVYSPEDESALFTARARALEEIGAHFEASFYLEAALAKGSNEKEILPRLIAALIRSDRLRAAKKYLDRLDQLAPGNQEIRELKGLLARFAPRDSTPGEQEIEP